MVANEQVVSVHVLRDEEGEEGEGKEEDEDKKEGEGNVKCVIAETKKGTDDAGTQTRAEMQAMLGNQVIGTLKTGKLVNLAVSYGLELKMSGIRLHRWCASFIGGVPPSWIPNK